MVYLQRQKQPQNCWMEIFPSDSHRLYSHEIIRTRKTKKLWSIEQVVAFTVLPHYFKDCTMHVQCNKTRQEEVNEWENTQTDTRKCEQRSLSVIDLLSGSQPNNGRALTRHHPLPLWFELGHYVWYFGKSKIECRFMIEQLRRWWWWWVICRIREHMGGTCPLVQEREGPQWCPSLFPSPILSTLETEIPPAYHWHWCDSWHISNMWIWHTLQINVVTFADVKLEIVN